jgi:integrase/recombinase XerC
MKLTPTPQLIRIPNSALVPTDSLPSGAITEGASEAIAQPINTHDRSKSLWEEFLRLQLKPRTRQEYAKAINYFCRAITPEKPSAIINQRITALKSLVTYAGKNGACSFSLNEIRSLKRQPYKGTCGVPVEDYRSILSNVDRSTDLDIRDYAILRLLWDLAMRREEVVSLDIRHYWPGKLMVLSKGKINR